MKTSVREERMIVVSDVHLGNRLFPAASGQLSNLIDHAGASGYNLCINGDGIDIMQMSLGRLTRELADCYRALQRFPDHLKVYYVVGNHDIVIEHFLEDWGRVVAVPFLNLTSGDLRIRVDHGHMYDELFVRFPRLYTGATVLGRWLLSFSPMVYRRLEATGERSVKIRRRLLGSLRGRQQPDGIATSGENLAFRERAEEISWRGFDVVTFGHTHHPGQTALRGGAVYYNTGSWLNSPYCLMVDHGRIWFGPVAHLLDGGAAPATPFRRT
jgi:UDP-2,3-diacylglucosamine pyrophosphatase LpxH